jgi:hypothetical protein
MIIDFAWANGLVVGIQHTDSAVIESGDDQYQFCHAILISLGFFVIALLMPEDYDDDDDGGTPLKKKPA